MRQEKSLMLLAVAFAVAALLMPQHASAQFGINFGGGNRGSSGFSFSFGNPGGSGSRGGSGFGLRFGSPGNGMNAPQQYRQQAPGFRLNPGNNLNLFGGGLGGSSGWNNWNSTPSYRPSYRPSYTPSYTPAVSSYAYSAPATTLRRPPAEPILLINPGASGTPVHYKVNEYPYIMGSGETQQLHGQTAWTIDFHRGGNYGRQKYGLDPGKTYRFTPTPRGWDLYAINPPLPPVPGLSSNLLQ